MPWIEIFKGGKQTDSAGRTWDGDALIEKAVATFDAADFRPPMVLGHPKTDSPAYGWVRGVKASMVDGARRLYADCEPVAALADWVNAGLYRNRSAAFYPNGRLRHVGFLGGKPPAVKGMAPLPAFADDESGYGVIEFSDMYQQGLIAGMLRRIREYIIEKDGAEKADTMLPSWEIEEIGRQPDEPNGREDNSLSLYTESPTKGGIMKFSEFMQAINIFKKLGGRDEDIDLIAPAAPAGKPDAGDTKTFTEADIEAAKKTAAEHALATARAEFADAEKKRRMEDDTARIAAFCDAGLAAGTLAPAWIDAGLRTFMEDLAEADPIQFAEGQDAKAPLAWFTEFLSGLPKLVDFSEIATRDKDVSATDDLMALARSKMAADKEIGFSEALNQAQHERPDLFEAWLNAPAS